MKKIFSKFFTRWIWHDPIGIYSFWPVAVPHGSLLKIFEYYFQKLHSYGYPNIYDMYMKALIIDINFSIISFWSEKKNFFFHYFAHHFRKHRSKINFISDYDRAH
jgi:hypothetical protein